MRRELLVRSKVDGDYETLQRRKTTVETKSPAELSQIGNFAEIPLPSKIEAWLQASREPKYFSKLYFGQIKFFT